MQICREFERFGKPLNVKVGNFFGGMDIKAQKDMLKDEDKCPDIVVGTPGRIKQVRKGACGVHRLSHNRACVESHQAKAFQRTVHPSAAGDI